MAEASLRDLLAEANGDTAAVKCHSCLLLRDLEGDDRKALSEALSGLEISAPVISKALASYGVRLSPSAISRHRRECGPVE